MQQLPLRQTTRLKRLPTSGGRDRRNDTNESVASINNVTFHRCACIIVLLYSYGKDLPDRRYDALGFDGFHYCHSYVEQSGRLGEVHRHSFTLKEIPIIWASNMGISQCPTNITSFDSFCLIFLPLFL